MENMKKTNKILIIVIIILIILLLLVSYISFQKLTTLKSSSETDTTESTSISNTILTEEEALELGTELYNKVETAFYITTLRPYCGIDIITDPPTTETFTSNDNTTTSYYNSGYTSLEDLKNMLLEFMSEDIIKKMGYNIYENELKNYNNFEIYDNYLLKDNQVYCRIDTGKGFSSTYVSSTLETSNITKTTITYNLTYKYIISDYAYTDEECNLTTPENCTEDQLETKTSDFEITKENDNWIVTSYEFYGTNP